MKTFDAYYNGTGFVTIEAVTLKPTQRAVITILDDTEDLPQFNMPDFSKYDGMFDEDTIKAMWEAYEDCRRLPE